jgi:hypothetical protein
MKVASQMRSSTCLMPTFWPAALAAVDQTVAIEHSMDGADRRRVNVGIEAPQPFPDLRRTPGRPVLLEAHDQRLDPNGEVIGATVRPARSVGQCRQATVVVPPVLREMPNSAQLCHLLQQAGNELAGARAVNDPTAINAAQIVISGTQRHKSDAAVSMPAFGSIFSDAEIAAVVNCVTALSGPGDDHHPRRRVLDQRARERRA